MALEANVAAIVLPFAVLWGNTGAAGLPRSIADRAVPLVSLVVSTDEGGGLSVVSEQGKRVRQDELASAGGALLHPDVALAVDSKTETLRLTNRQAESVARVDGFTGFEPGLGGTSEAKLRVLPSSREPAPSRPDLENSGEPSALAVFFQSTSLPTGSQGVPSPPENGPVAPRRAAAQGPGRTDSEFHRSASRTRAALLSAEDRADAFFATTPYSLRPHRGCLQAPRVFQPPATGF
jgi:hypothetical protein